MLASGNQVGLRLQQQHILQPRTGHIPSRDQSSVEARLSSRMIARRLWLLVFLGSFAVDIICSPVSFPTERSIGFEDGRGGFEDSEARTHRLHEAKRKRKLMRLACLLMLQQYDQHRSAPQLPVDGEGKTLLWGINYYNTDIHVYNGGYGGKPFAPTYSSGLSGNPCQGFSGLGGTSHFPNLPSNLQGLTGNLPSLSNLANNFPSIGSIGNEIIHVLVPGGTAGHSPINRPGSSSSGSSGFPAPVTTTTPSSGGDGDGDNGDGDNEDYDYSDGASDGTGNKIKRRRKPAPSNDRLLSGFRPAADRYLEDYLFRPVDRTFKQIIKWF